MARYGWCGGCMLSLLQGGRTGKPVGFEGKLLNLHVLLVDDELVIRKMATKFLHDLGCTACVLEDGDQIEEALQKTTRPFDSIFLDIVMPRTDGAVVCERLRSLYQVRLVCWFDKPEEVSGGRHCGAGSRLLRLPHSFFVADEVPDHCNDVTNGRERHTALLSDGL